MMSLQDACVRKFLLREKRERERSLLNGLDLEVETNEGEDKALDVLH